MANFEIQLEIKHLADYSCTLYIGILQERCVRSYKCFLYLYRLIELIRGLQVWCSYALLLCCYNV